MDLTVHEEGTYDAVIRMVDNTSSQITSTSQCNQLASSLRSSIATNKGSEIKVKSIKGDEGIGCEFTFKSIPVATAATKPAPNASATSTASANASANANASTSPTGATNALVWRQGNKVFVRIPGVNTGGDSEAAGASPSASTSTGSGGSGNSAGSNDSGGSGSGNSGTSGGSSKSGSGDDVVEKYKSLIDTKLTVTFPGAVIDAGGGKVQGHKVTWSGPQILATGVSASGYAIGNGGMPWYSASRPWAWLIVGSVFALTAFGFWRRRRARS